MTHKTVRALSRGIQILRVLQRSTSGASLNDLYKITKITRPTLLRLLATLEREELVWRRVSSGLYMASSTAVDTFAEPHPHMRLAEISAPVLRDLVKKVIWPSDLTVMHPQHRTCMYALESSRAGTPFPVVKTNIGRTVNVPWTAVGRAYLAFCEDDVREELISLLKKSKLSWDKVAKDRGWMQAIIDETRARGYGLRDKHYFGGHYMDDEQNDDRLSAIAIPVGSGKDLVACLNIVWLRGVHSEEHIVSTCLPDLRKAADAIVAGYSSRSH